MWNPITVRRGPPRFYTVSQLAAALAVRVATVRAWIHAGKLHAVRPGKRTLRIPREEFERMVAQGIAASGPSNRSPLASSPKPLALQIANHPPAAGKDPTDK